MRRPGGGGGGPGGGGGLHQADGVVEHRLGHGHVTGELTEGGEVVAGGDGVGLGQLVARGPGDDLLQFFGGGEGHQHLEEEAVELGFGQGIGPLHLQGVLGGEDEEGDGQAAGDAGHGGLLLLHGLQQGALGLGRGAVDLVGQDDVGEDRAGLEAELPPALAVGEDVGADHVGGHQVRGELDAGEGEVEGAAHRPHQGGLAQAGHPLQQHVAPGHQADQHAAHHVLLADDDPAHLGLEAARHRQQAVDGLAFRCAQFHPRHLPVSSLGARLPKYRLTISSMPAGSSARSMPSRACSWYWVYTSL